MRVVRDLMQDLVRETGSSVNSLSYGRIPAYLVSDLVEQILKLATTTVVQPSHVQFSLVFAVQFPSL